MAQDFLPELDWRGLLHQTTDPDRLAAHLESGPRKVYVGFDPTADSLTIGNLVPIMLLVHAQRAGHTPVVVMGGGTGLIGDPSGKCDERQLMTRERVDANVASQRRIFEAMLDFDRDNKAVIVNNIDWLGKLNFIEVLRDVGKHFSVNTMIQKDSVRDRLQNREQGISFTEFCYQILQAYDFLHLHREHGVTIQMGGSDQWGNIVAGTDLIRKTLPAEESPERGVTSESNLAFGLTCPLVTKADGGKFGKSESGAVWLTADRTSPYAFSQFWLNTADADVGTFLRFFTLLPRERIEELEASHAANPGAREAQRVLAREVTAMLHGLAEAENAEKAARALFSGDVADLPEATLNEVMANVPSSDHAKADLEGEGVGLVDLLVAVDLAQSKRQAREFLTNGSVTVNGRKVGLDDRLGTSDLLHGSMIALRRGKKTWRDRKSVV